jgi:hypothetical protein
MKKIYFLLALLFMFKTDAQTLSGNCTDNINATIPFDPASLNYVNTDGTTTFIGSQTQSGTYSVFPSVNGACNSLKKVIILVEGFDLNNSTGHNDIFGKLGTLGPSLNSQDYDVITLNFNQAKDYIERNAMILVELIKQVNNSKIGGEDLIIIGMSMGGLVTRHALTFMEANNMAHDCKLFITLDSPHKGANMSFGVQEFVLDLHNSPLTAGPVAALFFSLKSPAASQLLRHQVGTGGSAPLGLSTNMNKFYSSLIASNGCRGYPKESRNMAISLGALNASGQLSNSNAPVVPGQLAFDFVNSMQGGDIRVYPASPPLPSNAFVNTCLMSGLFINSTHPHLSTLPLDNAPGGWADVYKQSSDMLVQMGFSSNIFVDNASFVSVLSALDYKETDLFYNVSSDIGSNIHLTKTPFDEICNTNFTTNHEHIKNVDQAILTWIDQKIGGMVTAPLVCGDFNFSQSNVTQSTFFSKKVQNNITLTNITVNNNITYKAFAGNEILLTGDCHIASGVNGWLNIKPCSAPKACSYSDPNLRPMVSANNTSDFLPFTAESYHPETDPFCVTVIDPKKSEPVYTIDLCKKSNPVKDIISSSESWNVFPNPNNGIFRIVTDEQHLTLTISDISGKVCYSERDFVSKEINLTAFAPGIYFVKAFSQSGEFYVKKITITK